ncbi:MAG: MarR family winged helix-turn-helix transcriptional regulator [Desulfobulbaceae bacterium]
MRTCHSDDVLPRLIYLTSLRLQIHADKVLQPLGITLEQLHPLKILERGGGAIGQRQMCELSGKTPANMTRILDRLANKGFIERQPDPGDRRAFNIVLTAAGEKLVVQAVNSFTGYLDQVLSGVDEPDEAVCRRVLQQIALNLDGLAPEDTQRDDRA